MHPIVVLNSMPQAITSMAGIEGARDLRYALDYPSDSG
jgi:hypothetical protein